MTVAATAAWGQAAGTVKLGYIYTDEDGNESVYQPTFNLYDGPVLSLENFSYRFADGTRLRANLENVTLKNRNLRAGIMRSGLYGLNLSHSQYRRTYNFEGNHSTRRDRSNGDAWLKPVKYVKLFGGYGRTARSGRMVNWYEPGYGIFPEDVDYVHQHYHGGLQLNYQGAMILGEYRGGKFEDDVSSANDRKTKRMKVVAVTPVPMHHNIQLNGGFQRYEHEVDSSGRKLEANTVWAGGRIGLPSNFSAKYSFVFDRSRNTGDIVATDNIVNAGYLSKAWPGRATATVGYQHAINDDYYDAKKADAFFVGGSIKPSDVIAVRAEFGTRIEEVTDGQTLTGDEDRTRYRGTVTYTRDKAIARIAYEGKHRTNDDLGFKSDFNRASADLWWQDALGTLHGSYAFIVGDYENATDADAFEFTDHVVAGDLTVPITQALEAVIEGTYYRSLRDIETESFSTKFTGRYSLGTPRYTLAVSYAAHNFDDLRRYRAYYTANIVEITLSRDL
jgi:hypothetical protein